MFKTIDEIAKELYNSNMDNNSYKINNTHDIEYFKKSADRLTLPVRTLQNRGEIQIYDGIIVINYKLNGSKIEDTDYTTDDVLLGLKYLYGVDEFSFRMLTSYDMKHIL